MQFKPGDTYVVLYLIKRCLWSHCKCHASCLFAENHAELGLLHSLISIINCQKRNVLTLNSKEKFAFPSLKVEPIYVIPTYLCEFSPTFWELYINCFSSTKADDCETVTKEWDPHGLHARRRKPPQRPSLFALEVSIFFLFLHLTAQSALFWAQFFESKLSHVRASVDYMYHSREIKSML